MILENKENFTYEVFGYLKSKGYNFNTSFNDEVKYEKNNLNSIGKIRKETERDDLITSIFNNSIDLNTEDSIKLNKKQDKTNEEINALNKRRFKNIYDLEYSEITKELLYEYYDKDLMINYNNLKYILCHNEQTTTEKLEMMINNNIIEHEHSSDYKVLMTRNKLLPHYYGLTLLGYFNIDINDYNMNKEYKYDSNIRIQGKTIKDFLLHRKNEIYKLYNKKISKESLLEDKTVINTASYIVNKIYGLKIKINKKKVVTVNGAVKWNKLPHEIIPRIININDIFKDNEKTNEDIDRKIKELKK